MRALLSSCCPSDAHPRAMPSPAPMCSGSRHGRGTGPCHGGTVIRAACWRGEAVLWFARCQKEASLLPRALSQLPSSSFLGQDSPSGSASRWMVRGGSKTKSGSRHLSQRHEGTRAQVDRDSGRQHFTAESPKSQTGRTHRRGVVTQLPPQASVVEKGVDMGRKASAPSWLHPNSTAMRTG